MIKWSTNYNCGRPIYRESTKYSFLKSYRKLKMCFTCATYTDLSFFKITARILRVRLKKKYPSRLQKWFMNCTLIMCWQNFPKLRCRYEFIVHNRLWNSEIVPRWIQQNISRKITELEFENLLTTIIDANHVLTTVLVFSNCQDPV